MASKNAWLDRMPEIRKLEARPGGVTATEIAIRYGIDKNGVYPAARKYHFKLTPESKEWKRGKPREKPFGEYQTSIENTTGFLIGRIDQLMM